MYLNFKQYDERGLYSMKEYNFNGLTIVEVGKGKSKKEFKIWPLEKILVFLNTRIQNFQEYAKPENKIVSQMVANARESLSKLQNLPNDVTKRIGISGMCEVIIL